jgi:hypothetical protein
VEIIPESRSSCPGFPIQDKMRSGHRAGHRLPSTLVPAPSRTLFHPAGDRWSPPRCRQDETAGRSLKPVESFRILNVDIHVDTALSVVLSILATCCKEWSGRGDLNARPPAPKAGALPGCATPRLSTYLILNHFQKQCNGLSRQPCQNRDKPQAGPKPCQNASVSNISELGSERLKSKLVKTELRRATGILCWPEWCRTS